MLALLFAVPFDVGTGCLAANTLPGWRVVYTGPMRLWRASKQRILWDAIPPLRWKFG